jgi:hypothetical protein
MKNSKCLAVFQNTLQEVDDLLVLENPPKAQDAIFYKQYQHTTTISLTYIDGRDMYIRSAVCLQPDKIKLTYIIYDADSGNEPATIGMLISCDGRQLARLWDSICFVHPIYTVMLATLSGFIHAPEDQVVACKTLLPKCYGDELKKLTPEFRNLSVTLCDIYSFD